MLRRRDSLADAIVERYVEWREHARAVWAAYEEWSAATGLERELAFCGYRVAVSNEACACDRYAEVVARARSTGAASTARQAA
jgi:hypothetical protein